MLRKVKNGIAKLAYRILSNVNENYISIQSLRVKAWYKDSPNNALLFQHDFLNKNSCVFDLGGYKGEWAEKIFDKYQSNIYIFEPHHVFAQKINDKFVNQNKVKVFSSGLANENGSSELFINDNSSSIFVQTGEKTKIELLKASDFFINNKIDYIHLMKINIEGGEYDLLEHLIESGWINKIENIQVQFHDFFPDSYRRMARIQDKLEQTHSLTYQYLFVWENWKLKQK
ncbi:MAG: FkbM family methyltransferase [Bacteroidia bacterium]|jgi:FkbM family methyltransferase